MKLHEAEDIYDVILPIYILSKILGLAPFTIAKKILKPHFNPLTLVHILLVIGGMCYNAYLVETLEQQQKMVALALKCELYLGTLMTFTVLTLAIINQKLLIECVEKIDEIDMNMKNINIKINYKNSRRFVSVQIIFITCVFLLKVVLQFFMHSAARLSMYTAFNVFDYINTIMLFQYVDLLLLIRQRFIWMNRRLRQLNNYTDYFEKLTIPLTPIVSDTDTKKYPIRTKLDSELILNNLAAIYVKLCQLSRLVNRTYGIQILVTVGSRFVMITTQLINTYNIIGDPRFDSPIRYTLTFIYLFLHSSKIFMIASLSENTAAKVGCYNFC
ncbi:hypothetical protein AMK59_6730 [Oryctes borbonicus]|uniref:Gustatory receptor n=1 Tax=Oryctes borbonicus TaxID=1629725 RepID=A0A0T6AXD2_9SCAR|nr:hypothetical protein AMK59_6730 [Oryctes borbonicus]